MPKRDRVKPGHNPEQYRCANPECARGPPLDIRRYAAYPPDDVPPERIHYVTEPTMAGFSICCASCGHYTVVSPFERADFKR